MQRILIVYFDAGGGHRAAAGALAEVIRQQRRPWLVETLNLDDILEPADPVFRTLGIRGVDLYNWSLRKGWTFGSSTTIPIMHGAIRLLYPKQVSLLRAEWRRRNPDLVVSVIPHFDRALFESLAVERPGVPLVTILTDLADYPPHFWLEPQDQHFICGSDLAVRQAQTFAAKARIWRVSGMLIDPRFYSRAPPDRVNQLRNLGLEPMTPTGLGCFGGYGSAQFVPIAEVFRAPEPVFSSATTLNGSVSKGLERLFPPCANSREPWNE